MRNEQTTTKKNSSNQREKNKEIIHYYTYKLIQKKANFQKEEIFLFLTDYLLSTIHRLFLTK
jgi:hypothetical protein